ncbi:hypothetical protein SDC9_192584 [bioreactor metagenome]|uniref:Uncharacterized protein n=1 Tax=bioreactor metagenome TaxID=1076179 RepID=A0A645I156_9ZZZZ
MAECLDLIHGLLGPLPNLGRFGFENGGGLEDHVLIAVHGLQSEHAGSGLNAADAGGYGELAVNVEHAHLGGVIQVRAAAEFHRIALTHIHHPDGVTIFLPEQRDGPPLFGLLNG